MDVTLRFRGYPDEDTASEAWRHIDIHRQIRNHAVRDYYRSPRDDRPSAYDQHSKLPEWKRRWPTFAEVSAHAAQQTVSQIQKDQTVLKSHRENGRKTGRLKWQGAGEFRSVAYQSEGFNVNHTTGHDFGTLTLSKIGEFRFAHTATCQTPRPSNGPCSRRIERASGSPASSWKPIRRRNRTWRR